MKNVRLLLLAFMLLATTVTDKAIAQAAPTPNSPAPHPWYPPQKYNSWVNHLATVYFNAPIVYGAEIATTRSYTVMGIYPLLVDTPNHTNDSLTLKAANFSSGQIISIITTAALNDTLTIIHDGMLNGATATQLVSPATSASYKHTTIYFDGTNYWYK